MRYSELFFTIQGEGKYIGVPSVFFRTSYCDLRCWFCDTPYTSWKPENREISVRDAISEIRAFGCEHVVITGGEPFIQANELSDLCGGLSGAGHFITIETNGRHFINGLRADFMSISPKLASSTPDDPIWGIRHERMRINRESLVSLYKCYPCQIKFVVDPEHDIDEINQLVTDLDFKPSDVILMPQGIESYEIATRLGVVVELCKQYGYRYSPRVQIDIWGKQRGR